MSKTVAIVSGGLDSVVMAHMLANDGHGDDLSLLSFDYGQRHRKELQFAAQCARQLDAVHHVIDLSGLNVLLQGSSLTSDSIEVPDGHYAADTMRQTVVPNRNAIMMNIAAGYAISIGAQHVATAVHGGDHYIYPDCRPEFIKALDAMLTTATSGFHVSGFGVLAPFLYMTKAEIVVIGKQLRLDFTTTWSCYKGGGIHCGTCGTCFERREAFRLAKVDDLTDYKETPDYADPRVKSGA